MYSNKYFDELYDKAAATVDDAERKVMLEELFTIALDDAAYIPFAMPNQFCYWWPWVKNFYGETAYNWRNPPLDILWLDQALKADMGY